MKNLLIVVLLIVACSANSQQVVQLEYALDTDAGVGNNRLVNIAPSTDANIELKVDVTGLATGWHKLLIRTKDSDNKWSLTYMRSVEVVETSGTLTLTRKEYFIDDDPGFGNGTQMNFVSPDSASTIMELVSTAALSPGTHRLYERAKDAGGTWGQTVRTSFEVEPIAADRIVKGEYFFDEDPGFGKAIPVVPNSPDSVISHDFTASVVQLAPGYHRLYSRYVDAKGRWGQTYRRMVEVIESAEPSLLVKAEYFFNTDKGFGLNNQINFPVAFQNGTASIIVVANDIPSDADSVFMRVKDSIANKWSLTIAQCIKGVLPLTLLEFYVTKAGNNANLNWKTAQEFNTSIFVIQRSDNGRDFTDRGIVPAKNMAGDHSYSFNELLPTSDQTVAWYKLKMVDRDGSFTYSDVRQLKLDQQGEQVIVYPNPVTNTVQITFSRQSKPTTLNVLDMQGKLLKTVVVTGMQQALIDMRSLSAGTYVLEGNREGKRIFKTMVVKQ